MTEETGTPTPDPAAPDTAAPDPLEDVAKWKAMSRKHEAEAKTNAAAAKRLAEIEEAQKTDAQKAADKMADSERRAQEAEVRALRYEVGIERGIIPKLLRYLTGATREEIEASADQIAADFGADTASDAAKSTRPKEALRPGATPGATPDPGQEINDRIREAAGRRR
jgi:hypothetical protein